MYLDDHVIEQFASANFSANYRGRVCIFDLDKTYLDTTFETLWGLLKIPFETAYDKKNIPGAATIARELSQPKTANKTSLPLVFISGSPKQLRKVILKKFQLDNVPCKAIAFKDLLTPLKKFQLKKLVDKIGFKLATLLYAKNLFSLHSYEILFGDDSEFDATVYSLYADLLDGTIKQKQLIEILKNWKIYQDEIDVILKFYQQLQEKNLSQKNEVKKIYIHLETGSTPADHLSFGEKVTPTYNYFQTALLLYFSKELHFDAVEKVLFELVHQYNFSLEHLLESLEDLFLRKLLTKTQLRGVTKNLQESSLLKLPRRWFKETEKLFLEKKIIPPKMYNPNLQKKEKDHYQAYLSYVPKRRL